MNLSKFTFLVVCGSLFSYTADGQQLPVNFLEKLEYREIGPTRQSGRFVDFAVVEQSDKVFYAATASGGLWKTVNNGISFISIFDNESVISIGDVAVAPTDSSIVWVGTGEANNSRSSYWGDGVYKSTDGSKTWTNMGLKESQHIGRVLIHPSNPDIVYVAALGHLYSDNEERGLYKTTDGGNTWSKVLDVIVKKKNIGVVDVVMHPQNPDVLFAAAFDKIRTPWTYNEGGPGSAIYKSNDAGASWAKVEGGLPGGFLGRIGIDISKSNPDVMYANIENVNVEGMKNKERAKQLLEGIPLAKGKKVIGDEVYRSDDGGESWRKVSPDGENVGGGPAYYYQQVRIDPNDAEHVYILGVRMWETIDGGKNWQRPFRFGGDNHGMWMDPKDSKHMILGYDHGMGITYDGGKNWYHPDELPLAQFYAVDVDMDYPYNIYGGLQDNGSVKGPSAKRSGASIRMEDWKRVGGGDGMYNVVDKENSRWLYNESQFAPLVKIDQVSGERKSIAYKNKNKEMRWNWNAPVLISPHNSATIYHGGNKVVKSTNRGESWEEISPDLTTNDPAKIQGTGNIQYCTITSIDESPLKEGVIWVGTDDGNVQLTQDGGENWTLLNENITGNPGYWVSRVVASSHHLGKAYVTYTGYRRDDFRPFIFVTEDFGATWKQITKGMPNEPVNVIREDQRNSNLLFTGTEMGVFVSIDGGDSWNSMKNNMPTSPVHDMVIQSRESDLVVATHGRGIFIMNIQALQEVAHTDGADYLFSIRSKVDWLSTGDNNGAFTNFNGKNDDSGLEIMYYLQNESDSVNIRIFLGDQLINEIKSTGNKGLNKTVWNRQKRKRERTDKEMKQFMTQMDRFKAFLSDEQYKARMAGKDYLMEEAGAGNYLVEMEMNGKTYRRHAVILKDQWHPR